MAARFPLQPTITGRFQAFQPLFWLFRTRDWYFLNFAPFILSSQSTASSIKTTCFVPFNPVWSEVCEHSFLWEFNLPYNVYPINKSSIYLIFFWSVSFFACSNPTASTLSCCHQNFPSIRLVWQEERMCPCWFVSHTMCSQDSDSSQRWRFFGVSKTSFKEQSRNLS